MSHERTLNRAFRLPAPLTSRSPKIFESLLAQFRRRGLRAELTNRLRDSPHVLAREP